MDDIAATGVRKACAYCGVRSVDLEREHVFSQCLYPDSKAQSRVQRLTVSSCRACNGSWADDEAHFRNVLLLAGEPNEALNEIWPKAQRSFDQVDGHRRLRDLSNLIEPTQVDGRRRWKIYPARDERVLRVIKKMVRGLSHHHGLESAVSEARVSVDVMKYRIPEAFVEDIQFRSIEADVVEYWYESYDDGDTSSVWLLNFFERRMFIAWVSRASQADVDQ